MSNKMLEIKKLKDFMKERGIQEGEQFAMLLLTNWYMFDDCFGQIIGLIEEHKNKVVFYFEKEQNND